MELKFTNYLSRKTTLIIETYKYIYKQKLTKMKVFTGIIMLLGLIMGLITLVIAESVPQEVTALIPRWLYNG